jgi:hypothetical protein
MNRRLLRPDPIMWFSLFIVPPRRLEKTVKVFFSF